MSVSVVIHTHVLSKKCSFGSSVHRFSFGRIFCNASVLQKALKQMCECVFIHIVLALSAFVFQSQAQYKVVPLKPKRVLALVEKIQ